MGLLTRENYKFFVDSQVRNVKYAQQLGNTIVLKKTVKCLTETLEDAKISGFAEFSENIDKNLLKA